MNIVIDARWIFEELSGIGLYTRELIRNLALIDSENVYYLIFNSRDLEEREREETGFGAADNFFVREIGSGVFSPLSQLKLPQLLWKLQADIFHSPNYMIPFAAFGRGKRSGAACVITIHDLIPLLFPHYTPRALKTRFFPIFRLVMRQAALRADAVIVPSQSTRRDVIEHLYAGRNANVEVVYQGVTPDFGPARHETAGTPTILYVGRFDPYKNVPVLIEAFGRILAGGRSAQLRIVGSADQRYPEARELARDLGVDDSIRWDGYVDGEGLLKAYQQADLFVLPSRYEGFGLTALEAMACGTPVVCGNRSSLPEVVGDAAVTVDPDDVDALEQAIADLLDSPARAADLARAGIERAAEFTWRRTAENTLRVYESFSETAEAGEG